MILLRWHLSSKPNITDCTASSSEQMRSAKGELMAEKFERHRQPWRQDEIQKLHLLAGKGMSLKAISKALTRTEESIKDRAKADKLTIAKLR